MGKAEGISIATQAAGASVASLRRPWLMGHCRAPNREFVVGL
jgi:hypothetical protein